MQTSRSHEDVVAVAVAAIGADGTDAFEVEACASPFHAKCADVDENEQIRGELELQAEAEVASLEWQLQ